MRRTVAAVFALGLALGGILVPAVPTIADDGGEPAIVDVPAPDRAEPPAGTPHDPAPAARGRQDPAPRVTYSFVPAGVVVAVEASRGSRSASIELYRAGDDGTPVDGCDGDDELECTFSSLEPGEWRIHTEQDTGRWRLHWRWERHDGAHWGGWWAWSWHWHSFGISPHQVDATITIPAAPVIGSAVVAEDGSLAVGGTGEAGDAVHVAGDGGAVCDAVVDGAGAWSCAAPGPFTPGATLTALEEDTGEPGQIAGGLSSVSGAFTAVAVVRPVVVDPAWSFRLAGIDLSSIHPGDGFSISGSGLPPGLDVLVELHSDPVTIAATTVGEDGSFAADAVIPPDTEPGVHAVVVTLSGQGIEPVSKETLVTITAPDAPPPPPETPLPVPPVEPVIEPAPAPAAQTITPAFVAPPVEPAPPAPPAAPEPPVEHEEPAVEEPVAEAEPEHAEAVHVEDGVAPNILTDALEPITVVFTNPEAVASAFAIGLVLIILATVPAHLLNATLAEQYQRFSGRFARIRRPKWYDRLVAWMSKRNSADAIALVVVTAALLGFADPHFGFNDHSLRLVIGIGVALFFVAFVTNWVTALILRRKWSVSATIAVRPLGLILTVLGVLASRALDFSPGFLIGLVLGLSISTTAIDEFAWRAVAIRSSIIIGAAIAAWLGYSVLTVHGEPHDFGGALMVEILVALTTEGIVMLLVDLLPFKLLEGERLYARSKWLWGGIYLAVTVVFVIGVAAWEGNWRELGGAIWLWTATLVGFGLICVSVYLYFRYWAPPLPEEVPGEQEPLARIE